MSPERHARLMEYFDQACELTGDARRERLQAVERDDADLLAPLVELLDHHDQHTNAMDLAVEEGIGWLDQPVNSDPTQTEPATPMPDSIGPYRLIRPLGSGGMGIVYEAEQDHPTRRVALKVLRGVHTDAEALSRFRREARLLGRLQHRSIAQIYDAGETSDQPYLVMERITGVPIDKYAQSTAWRERLDLVARVCDGVQHAHQNGVLHRDLKASNILVEASGEPKILDFGVARAIDLEPTGVDDTHHTQTGHLVGTLDTMSPEQASGGADDVDTRCDVYALGVILYQALAGRLPLDLGSKSIYSALRSIVNDEPPALQEIAPHLPVDVITIVQTAMAKDRERRYSTAAALAADLRRCLRHETIAARPATMGYVLSRFARRHRVAVAATLIVFLALAAGLALAGWGLWKAEQERDRALWAEQVSDQRRKEAEAVNDVILSAVDAAHPGHQNADFTMRDFLYALAPRVERDLGLPPAVEARLSLLMGAVHLHLGDIDRAEPLLHRALDLADDPAVTPDTAFRAQLHLATCSTRRGRGDEALALLDRLLTQAEEVQDEASVRTRRAAVYLSAGRDAVALEELERVHALQLAQDPVEPAGLVISQAHAAMALKRLDRSDEAFDYAQAALSTARTLARPDHPRIGGILLTLGQSEAQRGHFSEAAKYLDEAIAVYDAAYDQPCISRGAALSDLSFVASERGQAAEAETFARRAVAELRGAMPDQPTSMDLSMMASAAARLGIALRMQGRLAEAEPVLQDAVSQYELHAPNEVRGWAWALQALAICRLDAGRPEDAEPVQRRALELILGHRGDDHLDTAMARSPLSEILSTLGRHEESAAELERALAIRLAHLGPQNLELGITWTNLGNVREHLGELERSYEAFDAAWTVRRTALGDDHRKTLESAVASGRLLRRLGRLEEAWDRLELAVEASARLGVSSSPPGLEARCEWVDVLLAVDEPDLALDVIEQGFTMDEELAHLVHPFVSRLRSGRGRALTSLGEFDEAESILLDSQRALETQLGHPHRWTQAAIRALVDHYEQRELDERAVRWRHRVVEPTAPASSEPGSDAAPSDPKR